jgi:hypothetical protein
MTRSACSTCEGAYAAVGTKVVVDAERWVHRYDAGLVAFVERREVPRVVCGRAHGREDVEQCEPVLVDLVDAQARAGEVREQGEKPGAR